tara:strand:+ start:5612 stop:6409 length:798 start_codon:yes stop_codon:yes gene_type:complete
MHKSIIFFSHNLGQLNKGVSKNKQVLQHLINSKNEIYSVNCTNNFYKNIHNLYCKNQKIYGNRINIGGDHSMAISTVSHSLNSYNNLKVIWIDAHPDINTYNKSLSKNYHGMPLSFLTGLDVDTNFTFLNNKLKLSNLMYIGLRDIDNFELSVLNKHKINQISINDIKNDFENSIKRINNFIGNDYIHISFDVDVLDPSVMPCTGLPVKNGLMIDETKNIIDFLNKKKVVSMDISELNLKIGTTHDKIKSLNTFFKIFENTLNLK